MENFGDIRIIGFQAHFLRIIGSNPVLAALANFLREPQLGNVQHRFAESSHWDPNWLKTSEQYYDEFIQTNLDQALVLLEKEPRRRYSVECVFFLRMYWERNPKKHKRMCELMNQGRLWMTHSGVTTADTLIPSEEALLRDFLLGQEWLRAIGVRQEPRTAYFADSFGCTPSLPSLLRAAGFERTAFTRIDGMYFAGCDYELARNFPREGSSAELLGENIKTQDFIWRDDHIGRLHPRTTLFEEDRTSST